MARLLRCTEAARGNAKIEIVFPLYFQLFSSMRFYGFITDSYMELAPSRIYISQCTSVRREWSFSNERIGGEWGCSWIFFAAPAAAKERGKGSGGERERETQWRRRRKRAYTLAPVLSHAMMLHRKKSWYDSLNRVTLKQYFNRNCITIQVQMNPNVNLWISWTMNILKVILFVLNVKLIYLK